RSRRSEGGRAAGGPDASGPRALRISAVAGARASRPGGAGVGIRLAQRGHRRFTALPFDELLGDVGDEARGGEFVRDAPGGAHRRPGEVETLPGAGEGDVGESAFLGELLLLP